MRKTQKRFMQLGIWKLETAFYIW